MTHRGSDATTYMQDYRTRDDVRVREARRRRARQHALTTLGRTHHDEYQLLYHAELRRLESGGSS